jgi:hypothetical protein
VIQASLIEGYMDIKLTASIPLQAAFASLAKKSIEK